MVQILRADDQLVRAAWHAIGRPRSQVRLSASPFETRTPQQLGFRLSPNDFDDPSSSMAQPLRREAEGLIVVAN